MEPHTAKPKVAYALTCVRTNPNDPRMAALSWIQPGSRVLEVGCGRGAVTRILKRDLGCSVVAVDIDPECVASLSGVADRFVCGDVANDDLLRQIAGTYDALLFMDVLEHMAWPEQVLKRILASVGGAPVVIVTIPNLLVWDVRFALFAGRFEYTDTGTLDRTHLRFYTVASAPEMLRRAGLTVTDVKHTWNVPVIGQLLSFACKADVEDRIDKVQRRFPHTGGIVNALLDVQGRINRAGYVRVLDMAAHTIRRLSPGLFSNHVVLRAVPLRASNPPS